jgi:hypothetical protein
MVRRDHHSHCVEEESMQSIIRITLVVGVLALAIFGFHRAIASAESDAALPAAAAGPTCKTPLEAAAGSLAIGPAVVSCGGVQCRPGTFCCNPSCGICTPKGVECTQQSCN